MPDTQQTAHQSITPFQRLLPLVLQGGFFVAVDFSVYPLYTVWTIQQSPDNGKHPTMVQAIQKIRRARGFYAGFSMQVFSSIPGTFAYLKGRELSLKVFGDNDAGQFLQGPVSIACGMLVWSPAATLTMLQQTTGNAGTQNAFHQSSPLKKINYIWKKEGVRGFYRGTLPFLLAFSTGDAIGSWTQAQLLKQYAEKDRNTLNSQITTTALAFGASAVLTSPIEVVFAYLKLIESNPTYFKDTRFSGAIRTIYRNKGYRGFFTGLPAHIMHSTLWHTILPFKKWVNGEIDNGATKDSLRVLN